ncbi:hypothetical protein PsAD2_01540 [Pseudovibrio axinellae]|uniref:Uncharacterized protein n=1 Tax=Pseudovibrio axinellae TaxID=989403 RepID=A0A165ZT35_9HYPH|nr:hypothetical protein PsAD2_01540 [Pseudovibrio axinellae]SEQ62411.1 hypothetical protein SAMN05421798_103261 [Pseudovibrio axinellae]
MFDDFFRSGDTVLIELCLSLLKIKCVPVSNYIDEDVQPRCAEKLAFQCSVAKLSQTIKEQCTCQRVLCLTSVEAGCCIAAHLRALPPLC